MSIIVAISKKVFPPLPPQTKDVGLRTQPNIERIYELKPDRIFIAPYFSSMKHRLVDIAPVTTIDLYESGITDWSVLTRFTRRFGEELGREAEADSLSTIGPRAALIKI